MPLAFKCSVTIQRGILFLTFSKYSMPSHFERNYVIIYWFVIVNNPKNVKFAEPEHAGLYASRNFYIYHNDPKSNELGEEADETQVRLGLWHILPDYIARMYAEPLNISEVWCYFYAVGLMIK